jgi:CheY-like chemotaxis protein
MKNYNELLIIDDDKIFILLIKRMFEKLGSTLLVQGMKNGQDGLDFLKNRYENDEPIPKIILLDLNMPMFDGWQFLEEIEYLPFADKLTIYVNSSTDNESEIERVKCYKSVKNFHSKPITFEILSKIMDDNLSRM